jgi:phage tail sheath protein FI
MPIQLTYPGVYVQEVPSGTHTITGVATSTTGFVGYLTRGPLNTPVQCLNYGDFQRAFGGLNPNSPTSFQVSQFFLNGGFEAWVSRLYASSTAPVQPQLTINGAAPPTSTSGSSSLAPPTGATTALTIESQNPGTWGLNVFVTVDYMSNTQNTFNLTATLYSISSNSNSTSATYTTVQTQSLPGVTLDPGQSNYVMEILQATPNPYASLITIETPKTTAASPPPYASGTLLQFATPAPATQTTVTINVANWVNGKAVAVGTAVVAPATSVTTIGDMIGAIQGAMSLAAGVLQLPALAGTVVRSCLSPFPPPPPSNNQQQQPPTPPTPAQLIQVVVPNPACATYLIGVTSSPSALITSLQTNFQSQQLTGTAPVSASPDGLPPTGFDVAGNSTSRTGIYALDAIQLINLICVPDMPAMNKSDYLMSGTAALNYALQRKAFALIDLPNTVDTPSQALAWITNTPGTLGQGIISAASYFPQVMVPNPFSTQPMALGGSGTMAGLYASTDIARGVWKAPAGITAPLTGVQQLQYVMNDQENGLINPLGLNAMRTFPIYGNISWGARTLAAGNVADDDWKYIPVRRLTLYIEQSLVQGLQWVVFEPNDDTLWAQIRLTVNSFLHPLFQQGAFAGKTPSQAYQVICDASTTTAEDMDNGIVNILVLFAPVRPAEFVVISIQQMTGQSSS